MAKWRLGYRTVKTALGAALAVFIAQLFQLDFYISAGIITVLCISVTRKESIRVSWERIAACMIGIAIGSVLFTFLGYHPLSIAIIILLFIPTAVTLGLKKGIVTSIVIIFHLYLSQDITLQLLFNELILITIGVGVALLMNSYMPNSERELTWKQVELEDDIRKIWKEFASYLRDANISWDGREISRAASTIEEAKGLALINMENQFSRNDDYFYHYFTMRDKQLNVIERMLPFISTLDDTVIQGKKIAVFMEELSDAVSPGYTAGYFLVRLDELYHEIKAMDLPKTREEFEIRSSLFYILHELEQYLIIKKMFKPDPKRTHTVSGKRLYRDQEKGDNKNNYH
ncbi:aromatic acid exporter family protein [Alteribacillus iranensis]|uniref:Uncharacterized membrane protein YgaE, UPF0421/DUF939 family n=1 Tax=Alteribacillus iranensis TaxID=930128 RepID=A0A1I1ZMC9_9BACI|nr:aromatic acid exporter family protein [Alteribacillus iranensis]SFE31733.1 Uncharacterized membrane protein YgaE, UPF0421/DUF939 family [Alteribacillus iranensis]